MSSPFDLYLFDDTMNAWRNLQSGRGVSTAIVQAEVQRHIDAGKALIETLTQQMNAGDITVAQWKMAVASELKDMHGAFAMFGAGGRDAMTPAMWGRVGGNLSDEFRHLQELANGIVSGKVSPAQAAARINQYSDASKQAYWQAVKEVAPEADNQDLPLLTTVPGDGSTQCRGNCNCKIVIHDDGSADVVLGSGESCDDCVARANGGPYRLN